MDEKLIERVRALLRLAGNNPEPEEAASAAAKAQEMMLKHAITLAQIAEVEGMESVIGAAEAEMHMQCGKSHPNWRVFLCSRVTQAFGGTIVWHHDYGAKKYGTFHEGHVHIFAEKDTLPGLVETLRVLILQIELGAATATHNRDEKWMHARTYKAQWITGAVDVVIARVRAMHRKVEQESAENSTALVRMKDAATALRDEHYPDLGRSRSARLHRGGAGYSAGQQAGKSMSLGGGKVASGGRMRLTA